MAYRILSERERKWQPRKGLEGPFAFVGGRVLYYDPKAGQYWDPKTDFYLSFEVFSTLVLYLVIFIYLLRSNKNTRIKPKKKKMKKNQAKN